MGTRNLTIVKSKGKTKVSQYGQWDGYPTGQGQTIADFLKVVDLPKFKKQINKLGKYTDAEIEKEYKKAGHDGGQWVTSEVANRFHEANPGVSRDHGAKILEMIHEGLVTKVRLEPESYKEDTSCEYWYVIDLDEQTVQMNDGKKFKFQQWTRKDFLKNLEKRAYEE
jgi:hypothetical protein